MDGEYRTVLNVLQEKTVLYHAKHALYILFLSHMHLLTEIDVQHHVTLLVS